VCGTQIKGVLNKLRPATLEQFEWAGLGNLQRFFGVLTFIILVLVIDCNNFFLKFVLWVPAEHDLLKFRVALWGLCSLATSKEWYEYISNEYCHRMGPFNWLTFYTASIEVLIVIKASEGQFTEAFPWYVKAIWFCIAILFFWLLSIAYSNSMLEAEAKKVRPEFNPYNPDIDIVNHSAGNKKQN